MTGEVDQDIDPVGADQAGHDVGADLTDIVPADELTAHPLGDFVRAWCIRVGIQGQAGVAGEVLQHGFEEARHRVTAEVAGNEADAQRALRIFLIGVLRPIRLERRFEMLAEPAMLGKQRDRVQFLAVSQREKQVAPVEVPTGIQFNSAPILRACLGKPSLLHVDGAQRSGDESGFGHALQGLQTGLLGFVEPCQRHQDDAENAQRLRVVRGHFEELPAGAFRFLVLARPLQHGGGNMQHLAVPRTEFTRCRHGLHRLGIAAEVVERNAEHLPAERMLRERLDERACTGFGFVEAPCIE